MIRSSAPGKLYVAGEYAVTVPGHRAVVVAVDRHATVTIEDSAEIVMTTDLCGGLAVRCEYVEGVITPIGAGEAERSAFAYVLSAITTFGRLLSQRAVVPRSFRLSVSSTLHDDAGRKFGLGSSGAVTAATIAALASVYGLELGPMDRFRLALLAVWAESASGSGGDVAASTWGGWIAYRSPDRQRVRELVDAEGIGAALRVDWPGLSVRQLPAPATARLAVGWTGSPVGTDSLFASHRTTAGYPEGFLTGSDACVDRLVAAIEADSARHICEEIRCAAGLLRDLDRARELGIHTPQLDTLCGQAATVSAAAKPSGAGGGDCGIAVMDPDAGHTAEELLDRWRAAGIEPLPIQPISNGAA
jgi:phosphomevalonate kinase